MKCLLVTVSAIAVLTFPAQAHHRHHRLYRYHAVAARTATGCRFGNNGRVTCGAAVGASARRVPVEKARAEVSVDEGTIIGSRPAGCPHAYCGCGLRKYLGLSDKRLNLARNWARLFPHEPGPAAGLAAVRAGHVMYIESTAGHGRWLIRDYNSGGGLSRLHVRDVRGYVFVDPHGRPSA